MTAPAETALVAAARLVYEAIRDKTYQRGTRLGGAVARYLAWKRPSASARTLDIYEGYLAALCLYLAGMHGDPELEQVTAEMLLEAAGQHPVGSYAIVRTSYRDFFNWADDWADLPRNPAKKLPKSRHQSMKVYDIFTAAEQALLIKAADRMPLPWIQRLRVLCLIDLGIRKDEARKLRPVDFDTTAKVVIVRGKGEKERVVQFSDELWRAFVTYLNRPIPNVRMHDQNGNWREARKPLEDDYLFFPLGYVKATGAVTWADPFRALQPRSMHSWWNTVADSSGIRYRSMHMARHTLGTNLSDAGEGLETIQDWLGHADPSTTKIYVHNSRSRLTRARGRLDEWRKAQDS